LLVFFGVAAVVNAVSAPEHHPWPILLKQWPTILLGVYNVATASQPQVRCHGVAWSLAVEEQFYLLAPTLVLVLGWLCRGRTRPQLAWLLALYAVIAVGLRLALVSGPLRRLTPAALRYPAAWSFDFLVLGVALFFLPRADLAAARWPRWIQSLLLHVCLAAPFVLMAPFTLQHIQREHRTLGYVAAMAASGGCFFVAVGLASLDRQLLYVHRCYDRVLLYLGSRSYSIYLLHVPGLVLGSLLVPAPESLGGWFEHCREAYEALRAAAGVLVWLPVVEVVHRCVEQPGIRLGRLLENAPAPAVLASPWDGHSCPSGGGGRTGMSVPR
jgi:peptidoglycan/LPS O-acetylase OafA/YrhL